MRQDLSDKLYNEYTPWFEGTLWGFECGDGWYNLLSDLCKELKEAVDVEKWEDGWEFKVLQVKEKYGGLRFYIGSATELIFDIIDKYEALSYTVCEICGEPGKLSEKNRWYSTLCQKHREEHGYLTTKEVSGIMSFDIRIKE
jgi:translation initiation factor 2 beta subunit (eIF-2beta)/eIF-5